jgi:hypothetical protein
VLVDLPLVSCRPLLISLSAVALNFGFTPLVCDEAKTMSFGHSHGHVLALHGVQVATASSRPDATFITAGKDQKSPRIQNAVEGQMRLASACFRGSRYFSLVLRCSFGLWLEFKPFLPPSKFPLAARSQASTISLTECTMLLFTAF